MIKLTALNYKVKTEALERFHNINEHSADLMFDWEQDYDTAKSIGGDYPVKPFVEPFEFEDDDYDITEQSFRLGKENILVYKENLDGLTEIAIVGAEVITVKETVTEIDNLLL